MAGERNEGTGVRQRAAQPPAALLQRPRQPPGQRAGARLREIDRRIDLLEGLLDRLERELLLAAADDEVEIVGAGRPGPEELQPPRERQPRRLRRARPQ